MSLWGEKVPVLWCPALNPAWPFPPTSESFSFLSIAYCVSWLWSIQNRLRTPPWKYRDGVFDHSRVALSDFGILIRIFKVSQKLDFFFWHNNLTLWTQNASIWTVLADSAVGKAVRLRYPDLHTCGPHSIVSLCSSPSATILAILLQKPYRIKGEAKFPQTNTHM